MSMLINGVPRQYVWALLLLTYLLSTTPVTAQWRRIDLPLHSFGDLLVPSQIFSVRFLDDVGAPQIGLACGNALLRTSDGGWTWKVIDHESIYVTSDVAFKDKTTGWLTWIGSATGGVSKTTDGGESWVKTPISWDGGGLDDPFGLYYCHTTGLLVSGGDWIKQSSDEGRTWERVIGGLPGAGFTFAFASADTGVYSSSWGVGSRPGQGFRKWNLTTDGCRTWQEIPIDSSAWQPLAIPHTKTYFSLTPHGNFLRTDDNWSTWRLIHTFPLHDYGASGEFWQNSSVVRGNLDSLFVRTTRGVEFSTDKGISWVSLCGPRSDQPKYQTFYVVGRTVFCSNPWTPGNGAFWRLNLDSLNVPTDIACRFTNDKKTIALDESREARVMCKIIDRTPDSVRVRIQYDTDAFMYSRAEIPPGWTSRESQENGVIDLSIVKGQNASATDKTFALVFSTFVSKPSADLIVELQKVFSYDFDASCIESAAQRPDTLTVLFDDCISTQLLDQMSGNGMQGRSLLEIQEVTLQGNQLLVNIRSLSELPVALEVFDLLGTAVISRPFNGTSERIEVSNFATGSYFVRLRQGTEVLTRKITID